MTRNKKTNGLPKPKTMFKPYDAAAVPACMPLPQLVRIHVTKTATTLVPKLNQHQQAWIFDVALRDVDLSALDATELKQFYVKVKSDAFKAKPFQHQPKDADKEAKEEAQLAKQIKGTNPAVADSAGDDSAASKAPVADDDDEDEGGRGSVLRGFPQRGWCKAIQKSLSNRLGQDRKKRKMGKTDTAASVPVGSVPASALSKIFGIADFSGRDLFRQERKEEILAHSKTLPGVNPGGKSRKAEAELWAQEDHAKWDREAASEEDVDYEEKHMVDTLNGNGKFRPFIATMLIGWLDEYDQIRQEWVEAVPQGVHVRQRFEDQYPQLVTNSINAMHSWAEKPLQDYAAVRNDSTRPVAPVFPLSVETMQDMSPNAVAHAVTEFLVQSYEAAFGDADVAWGAIVTAPDKYYDTRKFNIVFSSSGLQDFKGQWHALGDKLASGAGEGSLGFFRKLSAVPEGDEEAVRVEREKEKDRLDPEEEERLEEEEREEQARLEREQEEQAQLREKERLDREEQARVQEKQRLEREDQARIEREREKQRLEQEEQAHLEQEREKERLEREEQARLAQEREKECLEREERARLEQGNQDKGKRTAADAELVPDEGTVRRTKRSRKTPAEAEEERQQKLAATVGKKAKPGYDYVITTSPVQRGRARK